MWQANLWEEENILILEDTKHYVYHDQHSLLPAFYAAFIKTSAFPEMQWNNTEIDGFVD